MPTTLEPIQITAGVESVNDKPRATTSHYTYTRRIRFVDGYPEKIGGWERLSFDGDLTIDGCVRSVFSYKLNGLNRYLLGSNTKLYDIFGTTLTNITPLETTTTAIANSLDTFYGTLGSDPISTVSGSASITIADTGTKLRAGDTVTLSGATATNGIPAGDINTNHYVRSVTANSFTIIVPTPATSTGSGGGASIVRATGIVQVNATAHGRADGDRVKIAGAVAFGGITAVQINLEFIIRNTTTNAFDVVTAGTATSAVTGGGGAGTTYQVEIDTGPKDTALGQGYGLGLYGVGLYGVSKTSSSNLPPRIWSHDRFGDLTVSAYNAQSDIYSWNGDRAVAPAKVLNSYPSNYVFVSNNIVVSLGYDPVSASAKDNAIAWSDQGGLTNWTTGQAGSDIIEGAGKFISHASTRGDNLLFTENQTYVFTYIGDEFIWSTTLLDASVGLIAQNARATASGVVFWMGNTNFYMWRGGNVEVIPSNSSTESTILRYVFEDMNFVQKEKIFAWYNPEFREIWWHYPSSGSNEPDRVARFNIDTYVWCMDDMDRTAAEYPSIVTQTPYLVDTTSKVQLHENGFDDDGVGMSWQLTTNRIYGGTDTIQISSFIPDQNMSGSFIAQLSTRDYPSSGDIRTVNYTITSTTDRVACEQNGRYWQFNLFGSSLNQELEFGQWYQEVKRSSPK